MPSTYSNLKIQLMATGENNTTWGDITNTNLGTALEEAIAGSADVTFASADVTLTLTNTNASQTARNVRLRCTGTTGGSARNLIVPSIEKPYIVRNDCADSITVKTSAGTGIAVPAGRTMWVFSDGTNVVDVVTHLSGLTLTTALPVAQGGTGATSITTNRLLRGNGTSAFTPSIVADDGTTATVNGSLIVTGGSTTLGAGAGSTATVNGALVTTGGITTLGAGAGTGPASIELGAGRSGSGASFIDLHSSAGLDFSARVLRDPGVDGVLNITNAGTGPLTFNLNGSERMRIDASGNVGIGAASPAERLFVQSTSGVQIGATNGTVTQRVGYCLSGVAYSGAASNHPYALLTNDVERVRIDTSGNVGVGTSSPTTRLDVSGSVTASENFFAATGGVWFNAASAFTRGVAAAGSDVAFYVGGVERFRIISTGAITSADLADAVGYKGVPGASVTSGTLTSAEMGECVPATGNVTAPSGTFSRGFTFSIYNDSASAISIVQGSGLTLRLAGTTTTGTRTLAARGMATIWYNSASEAIVSGAGVS
jgi:hypothetical protein